MFNSNTSKEITTPFVQHAKLMFRDEYLEYTLFDLHPQFIHQIRLINIDEEHLNHFYLKYKIFMPFNVARACLKRKCEFFIGRLAAKLALASLGSDAHFIIKKGQYGEPLWPEYITGSISHSMLDCTHGIGIATATKNPPQFTYFADNPNCNNQNKTIISGLDIEIKNNIEIFKQNPNILKSLMTPQETKLLNPFLNQISILYLIVFSAKESVIKAFYNTYQKLISFDTMHCIGINITTCTLSFYISQISSETTTEQTVQVNYLELEHEVITYCRLSTLKLKNTK